MADYQSIMRLRPEVREFIRNRRWVHHGDAIFYGANIQCRSFSTDSDGFRHSSFNGESISVADCIRRERYGLVLGSSHVYGFGLAGNENTLPSLLAERFGFPFANVSIPEADSRNLFSLLAGLVSRASNPPAIVIHLSGGDFTSFCFTSIADPFFGPPNLRQARMVLKERGGRPRTPQFPALLAFSALWTNAIANYCRTNAIPVLFGDDTSFFEKDEATAKEQESALGVTERPGLAYQFDIHRQYFGEFRDRRRALAAALSVPVAGPASPSDLTFIDEFHYDREGTRLFAGSLASAIEPLIAQPTT